MPPSLKREDCKHVLILKKLIGFPEAEQKQAKAKGLQLPDYASLEFCAGCWAINPHGKGPTISRAVFPTRGESDFGGGEP